MSQIIWEAILDGRAVQNPQEHLNRFLLVSFADLKKYQFHYMAAVPAFMLPPITEFSIKCLNQQSSLSVGLVCFHTIIVFNEFQIDRIKEHRSGILELGFFLIDETGSILPLSAFNPELKHVTRSLIYDRSTYLRRLLLDLWILQARDLVLGGPSATFLSSFESFGQYREQLKCFVIAVILFHWIHLKVWLFQ